MKTPVQLVHTLKIDIKSCTEMSISIAVRIPHDVVCIPNVVVDVERKASDWLWQWLQWCRKDVWRVISNKRACYWNVRRTQSRHVDFTVMMTLVARVKNNAVVINHCNKESPQRLSSTFKVNCHDFTDFLRIKHKQIPNMYWTYHCITHVLTLHTDRKYSICIAVLLNLSTASHTFIIFSCFIHPRRSMFSSN